MKLKNVKAGVKVRVKDVDQLHWAGAETLSEFYDGRINTVDVYTIDKEGVDSNGTVGIGGDRDDRGFVVHHTNLRKVK